MEAPKMTPIRKIEIDLPFKKYYNGGELNSIISSNKYDPKEQYMVYDYGKITILPDILSHEKILISECITSIRRGTGIHYFNLSQFTIDDWEEIKKLFNTYNGRTPKIIIYDRYIQSVPLELIYSFASIHIISDISKENLKYIVNKIDLNFKIPDNHIQLFYDKHWKFIGKHSDIKFYTQLIWSGRIMPSKMHPGMCAKLIVRYSEYKYLARYNISVEKVCEWLIKFNASERINDIPLKYHTISTVISIKLNTSDEILTPDEFYDIVQKLSLRVNQS